MNKMADSPQIKLRLGGYDSDDEKVQETNLENLDEDDDDDENANALKDSTQKHSPTIKARKEVKNFCSDTTAHGIRYTVREDIIPQFRILWIVICLSAMAGNCWQLYTVISAYLAYPVTESTFLTHNHIPFPHITVCNQLATSQTNTQAMLSNTGSAYSTYLQGIDENMESFAAYKNRTKIAMDDLLGSPNGLYANIEHSEISTIGHSLHDLILYCSYAGRPCDMDEDFEAILDPSYGNCYTFTGKKSVGNSSIGSGPHGGLSLILFLEATVHGSEMDDALYNRYSPVENAYGLRVEMHQSNTLPNPRDSGFNIMPGRSTALNIRADKVTKLGSPYGECLEHSTLSGFNEYTYSHDRCIDVCLSQYIYNQCNCTSAMYPIPSTIQPPYTNCISIKENLSTFFENFQCEHDAWDRFLRDSELKKSCLCYEPCDRYQFSLEVSQSEWPGSRFLKEMYREFIVSHSDYTSLKAYHQLNHLVNDVNKTDELRSVFLDNFARLNVYFGSTSLLEHVQLPAYPMSSLWSNIGGTIGLWAGLSLITILEVVFLCVNICHMCCNKRKK